MIDPHWEEPEEDDVLHQHHHFLVSAGQNPLRIDKFLMNLIEKATRNKIQQAAKDDMIWANGVPVKSNYKVKPHDEIQVMFAHPPHEHLLVAEDIPLDIVYEDHDLMVVNKPAGMVVHPAFNNWTGTLVNALLFHFGKLPSTPGAEIPRPGLVHRLDKDTSGLMVVARTRACMDTLVSMIAARDVHREYLALSQRPWRGELQREVKFPIGRDPRQRLRMAVVDLERQSGKHAHTSLQCLDSNDQGCLVHCTLHTGRTHQIRVHMAAIGLPLLADGLYGGAGCLPLERQALHAFRLGFIHPFSHEELRFNSPVPPDMLEAQSAMGLQNPLG